MTITNLEGEGGFFFFGGGGPILSFFPLHPNLELWTPGVHEDLKQRMTVNDL